MNRKMLLFLAGLVFCFSYQVAAAEIIFNEIAWKGMSTGATHEWLELYNPGSSTEDISAWVIRDEETQLNIVIPADTVIGEGGYYVIKRSTSTVTPFHHSATFNGGLIDSGEKLIIEDATGAEVDTMDFLSGWPDLAMTAENTMQRIGSSWITASPTPGAANQTSPSTDNNNSDDNSNDDSNSNTDANNSNNNSSSNNSSSSSSNKSSSTPSAPKVKIIAPKVAFTGIPFELKGESSGLGRYFWNFGDGSFKETKDSKSFPYTYSYEGDYVVSLEYYAKNYSKKPDATATLTIKVVPMDVIISRVGDVEDFFVEISNNTSYEMYVSGWTLSSLSKNFVFPRNSVILPKKKLILSSKTTGFNLSDKDGFKLANNTGQLINSYGGPATVYKAVAVSSSPNIQSTEPLLPIEKEIPESEVIMPEDLSAAILSADAFPEDENAIDLYVYVIFVIFVVLAVIGVYLIRRINNPDPEDDFTIID